MLINRRRLVNSLRINYALKRGGCHGTCSIKPLNYAQFSFKDKPSSDK
jgi:hypothetical protein